MTSSLGRVSAMVLRYFYLFRGSWPRILEMAYWPTMQIVMWGFITQFMAQHSSWVAQAFGVLLSAALLWDILFRGQLGVSVSFLEEMWSRNLGHVFVSPLRTWELLVSLTVMSLIRTLIGVIPASLLAILFFGYSIYEMGFALVGFFALLLMTSWAIGFAICGMLLRFGLGAESLAWVAIFALAPISGIYYPLSVMPEWLQAVAWCLPPSYVFEGMRAVLVEHQFRADLFWQALALNGLYLIVGSTLFMLAFRSARRRALLLQIGE